MGDVEYTHCQDYEPHEMHLMELEVFEGKRIYCVGSD